MNNIVYAILPFLLFGFICTVLTKPRFSAKCVRRIWCAVLAAIAAVHLGIGFASLDNALFISLMPLTAYLPAIAALFVLSERNVASNLFCIFLGLLAAVCVGLLRNLFQIYILEMAAGIWADIIAAAVLVLLCAAFGFSVVRWLRGVFGKKIVLDNSSWYILVALFLLLGLSLYEKDSTRNAASILLLLMADVAVFAVIVGYIGARDKSEKLKNERERIERQIALERSEYALAEQKLQLGRRYRHDMRHHYAAIKGLVQQGDTDAALAYVEQLGEGLAELEQRAYCKNPLVNAVLSACMEKAEGLGIAVDLNLDIPEQIPFDDSDICAVLANAAENAVNACAKIAEGERRISVAAAYDGKNKLTVSVQNSTAGRVPLGEDGFPAAERTEEHGWGLVSVRHIAEKYSGMLQCTANERSFTLRAVLFALADAPKKRANRRANVRTLAAVPAVLLSAILALNFMPATVDALEGVFGTPVAVIDFRRWGFGWGDSGIEEEIPQTGNDAIDRPIEEYVAECEELFWEYFFARYDGYVGADITSDILTDDGRMLVIAVHCTVNAGSSGEYCRYFVADKARGELIGLAELFEDGAAYAEALSAEIVRQIEYRVGGGDFYYGFGMWEGEAGFEDVRADADFYIDADTNFYIEDGNLVIVFDEGEIAPGSMGAPSFTIPASVTDGIAAENSLLAKGAEQ